MMLLELTSQCSHAAGQQLHFPACLNAPLRAWPYHLYVHTLQDYAALTGVMLSSCLLLVKPPEMTHDGPVNVLAGHMGGHVGLCQLSEMSQSPQSWVK